MYMTSNQLAQLEGRKRKEILHNWGFIYKGIIYCVVK